jgi:hypothetical protein
VIDELIWIIDGWIMIIGWRVKAEGRQEWSRTVEETKTHPGL